MRDAKWVWRKSRAVLKKVVKNTPIDHIGKRKGREREEKE